ncbi:MAG: Cell surface protein [Ignavibacteriae bacterium]|nr:MAG: Cell surface protein [Ignavibacteriota bacterium]
MKLKIVSVAIVLMSLVVFVSAPAQIISTNEWFVVPLTVSNAGNANVKTIYFGGHRNATYCVDPIVVIYLSPTDSLLESELPPSPPDGVFDVRFVDSRTGDGKCMDQGIEIDIREWSTTIAIKDTFRVKFQPGDPGYPVTFSWPANLNEFYTSATLTAGDVIDMLTQTSIEITDDMVTSIRIIATKTINSVKIENEIPESFALFQNYPNPFNPSTKIKFSIPAQSNVDITIFDVLGRKVNTLVSENLKPGVYSIEWNGLNAHNSPVSSGIYYCKMNAIGENGASYTQTLKLLLMK